jgi:hypothetical protein
VKSEKQVWVAVSFVQQGNRIWKKYKVNPDRTGQ